MLPHSNRYVVCRQGAAAASAAALAAGSDPAAAARAGAEAALAAISALPRPLSSSSQQLQQSQQQQNQQNQQQQQQQQGGGPAGRPSGPCFGSALAQGAPTSTLVVSKFVGCSPSLSGAIRVNPWSVDAVADGIYSAITLPRAEAALRHDKHWR